jgi:MFS family permease
MLELHLISSAADALVVTALASTIFFAVPTEQARGRVATSLLVTMVPFVLLAPVIGPLLDRVRRGRRIALGVTMGARAWLAWVMAGALADGEAAFSLYPAAFAFLVSQKSYLVIRAAAVPRVLPDGEELVGANARMSAAGVVAMILGGPLGVGITRWAGPEWTLRLTFLLFLAGIAVTLMLPTQVDSDQEEAASPEGTGPDSARPRATPRRFTMGRRAVLGLRGNAALRGFTGFLTLFLAFRLRTDPLPGMAATTAVALVVVLAAVGSATGTALGGLVRRRRPELVVVALLIVLSVVTFWASVGYGLVPILAVSLVAGLGQALGKLCLDALIQDEVPDAVRTSAFARSETALQLAWVLGGALGLALPLSGAWGLGVATLVTGAAAAATATSITRLAAYR